MPNIYTHYFEGMQALAAMPEQLRNRISPEPYRFGLHGPDFLFYYNTAPLRPNLRVPILGSGIHRRNTGEFLAAMLDFAANETGARRVTAESYMAGFLGHYALDTTAHPYVYYFSKTSKNHTLFETLMDACLLKMHGETTQSLKPDFVTSAGAGKWCIADMYKYALKRAHGLDVSRNVLVKAMNSFRDFMHKVDDPEGKRYRKHKRIEKLLLGYPIMTRALHPPQIDDRDYLNLNHKEWRKPWDKSYVSNKSMPELIEDASNAQVEYVQAMYRALDNSMYVPTALRIFGQKSFLTGENWRNKRDSLYFECIFSKQYAPVPVRNSDGSRVQV